MTELAEFHELDGEPLRCDANPGLAWLVKNLGSALDWHGIGYVSGERYDPDGRLLAYVDLRRFRNVCAKFVEEFDKRVPTSGEQE